MGVKLSQPHDSRSPENMIQIIKKTYIMMCDCEITDLRWLEKKLTSSREQSQVQYEI